MLRQLLPTMDSITDVAERQLCTGCGVCAYVQPQDITMVDDFDAGRRPMVRSGTDGEPSTQAALACCPGVGLRHDPDPAGAIAEVRQAWGPVLEVWEGYASDSDIRYAGSSGGSATALADHAISQAGMHGVLHIRAREDMPFLNETILSTTREELMSATGSRYAPASPCDRLDLVRDAPAPCVFIGKPCDVAATSKARAVDVALDEKLGLTIAIFCAGTPTTRGTLEMLTQMGVDDPMKIVGLRYRGRGWPGLARVRRPTPYGLIESTLTYSESWGQILERHRQWRCYVCADHTGEFADIAVGDPWYRKDEDGDPGRSLIVVRTERGRAALAAAIADGAITAHRVNADRIAASQPGLLRVRGAVWGRTFASRLAGVPVPNYEGLPTFMIWLRDLGMLEKQRSVIGLWRRIKRRGLRRRHPVVPFE